VSSVSITGVDGFDDTLTVHGPLPVSVHFDGGAAGFDSIAVLGDFDRTIATAIDAHSGTILSDGWLVTYEGLEPTTISGASPVIEGSAVGNAMTVSQSGDVISVAGNGMETVLWTIVAGGTLTIRGGDGVDSVTISGALALGTASLVIEAETIVVPLGASITAASVRLDARAERTAGDGDAPSASVTVAGTIVATGAVTLSARTTDTWSLTSRR
jgi:hypothetical protein